MPWFVKVAAPPTSDPSERYVIWNHIGSPEGYNFSTDLVDATQFESKKKAESAALLLGVTFPNLIGRLRVCRGS